MKKETVEEYLARGGEITHLKDDDREIRAQQQWTLDEEPPNFNWGPYGLQNKSNLK